MPANPLFSTYRGGENRVTSSMMAVFERLDLALVRDLLAAATGAGDELRAVTFENQIVASGSIPDARITGRFTWWFETKTVRGSYAGDGHDRRQLIDHARLLDDDPSALLFVLTPDPVRPHWFSTFDDTFDDAVAARIIWVSFAQLAAAVSELTSDTGRLLSEQTRFLLAELIALFEADGLLTSDDTVIVAARNAWPAYHDTSAYVCQPDRSFRDGLSHFGFYADGAIQPLIARIRSRHPNVTFTAEVADQLRHRGAEGLADLIEQLLAAGSHTAGEAYGVLLLSGPDDPETVVLDHPIVNDTVATSGRTWAWTMSQRYTSLDRLCSGVRTTSALAP